MGLYLIDFENVHDSGISGIPLLSEQDEVCIFYSAKSEHMSFETHVNILQTSARINYIKLRRSAKNYLDFQLVTHLGYLIGSGCEGPYYIISKDTGFDSVIDYWKDHGVIVKRQPSIQIAKDSSRNNQQNHPNTPPALVTIQENKHISGTAQMPIAEIEKELHEEIMETPAEPSPAAEQTEEASVKSKSRKNNSKKSSKSTSKRKSADQKQKESTEKQADNMESETSTALPAIEEPSNKTPEDSAMSLPMELPAVTTVPVAAKPDSLPESYRKKVRLALKGKEIPSAHYSSIYKAIVNSYDKLALNNLLVKTFGSNKGGVVYNLIRDIFIDFHSSF